MTLGTSCRRRYFFLLTLLIGITAAFVPPRHYCYRRTILHTAANKENTRRQSSSCIWTETELMEFASEQGVTISLSTLGPGYRAVARAKHNTNLILGYVEGVLRPGVLHLDKMEVFHKQVLQARAENPKEFKQGGTFFGVGLLMGYMCLLYGMNSMTIKTYPRQMFLSHKHEKKTRQAATRDIPLENSWLLMMRRSSIESLLDIMNDPVSKWLSMWEITFATFRIAWFGVDVGRSWDKTLTLFCRAGRRCYRRPNVLQEQEYSFYFRRSHVRP